MTEVGWVLLPLRLFLGITMIYAGLLKFFDPAFLDPTSPNGVRSQMLAAAPGSPIGPLVTFSADHAALFGLTIAMGELLVGLGVLLGLWTRIAALGGLLLSLSFFLTVSWGTSPYFFGPDIVFVFAFTPLIIGGDGGLYSLQVVIRDATRRRMRLAVPPPADESAHVALEVERRTLLRTGVVAGGIAVGAALLGGVGRLTASARQGDATAAAPTMPAGTTTTTTTTTGGGTANGVKLGKASSVPVGGVKAFTDPTTGDPAYLLQPKAGTYLAYSAVCTHQGCTVGFDQPSGQFACPCHGARFDASNGDAVRGPARQPLRKINVTESNGVLYAV
ncbi:MAG: Rieske 2Fe-2S domain-containing protein [Actinomycetales bacterium]|nr:Rieske 2Fe-2S domain-containing protein [Actinomycetales bacterium]